MANGKFITIEGIDGAGKSTQCIRVAKSLQEIYPSTEILKTREPGGCKISEAIRSILMDPAHTPLWETEVALLLAARLEHVETRILPALNRGAFVICDRFTLSTYAYQAYGRASQAVDDVCNYEMLLPADYRNLRDTYIKRIGDLYQWFGQWFGLHGIQPDLTVILDMDADNARQRIADRNSRKSIKDRFQSSFDGHLAQVRQGFLDTAHRFKRDTGLNLLVLDALCSQEDLTKQIIRRIA